MNRTMAAAILGVPEGATVDEARKAYRARARLLHPDRLGGMSSQDAQTAHTAMAQLNEAMEVFQEVRYASPTSAAQETPQSHQRTEPALVGSFPVTLSSAQGRSMAGVLLIYESPGQGRAPIFRSDDLDVRGQPLVMGAVALFPDERPHFAGRLDLRDGGFLVVKGGKSRAHELMECLRARSQSFSYSDPPPQAPPKPSSQPPSEHSGMRSQSDDAHVDIMVPPLNGLAGGGSTFELRIEPGQVAMSSCVAMCDERGYHACALDAIEAEDLAEVIAEATRGPYSIVPAMPYELRDLAITRLNPGDATPRVLLDWRSNWNRADDGDAADRAWRCVTLQVSGSSADAQSQVSLLIRVLSAAASYARLWQDGEVNQSDVLAGMRNL